MKQIIKTTIASCIFLFLTLHSISASENALSKNSETLKIDVPQIIHYQAKDGTKIIAQYFQLSDKTLSFVKLTMPDGKKYTLPQVVSASGTKYTNNDKLVWWQKGKTVYLEERDKDAKWKTKELFCPITPQK